MVAMNGFKIVRVGSISVSQAVCNHAIIDYSPKLKYRVEKRNAYDPTYIHQREPYHEDSFKLTMMISPQQYQALLAFLAKDGDFYLLYTSAGANMEYPILVDDLPPCPDDLHEYPTQTVLKLVSRYLNYAPVIDPEIQELTAFDEILIIDESLPVVEY